MNFKGGYGFHPLLAWCDNTGELLVAIARPGNAGRAARLKASATHKQAVTDLPGTSYSADTVLLDARLQRQAPPLPRSLQAWE